MTRTATAPDLVEIIQAIIRDQMSRVRIAEVGVVTEIFLTSLEATRTTMSATCD